MLKQNYQTRTMRLYLKKKLMNCSYLLAKGICIAELSLFS